MKEKSLLIEKTFKQGENELGNKAKSAVANYLSIIFEEKFGFTKNERTFVRYYDSLVENKTDYTIDEITLDQMSLYCGYLNFNDFCLKIKNESLKITVSGDDKSVHAFSDLSEIIINITVKPIFAMSEFLTKQNSTGIVGMVLVLGILGANFGLFNNSRSEAKMPLSLLEKPEEKWMYWDENEYKIEGFSHAKNDRYLVKLDTAKLKNFKKITRPDTISYRSKDKIWYSKHRNKIEFFTDYGINPENNKTLKPVSDHIIARYVKEK